MLGTFGYMAPEQVRGLAVDHRADIFAFGAVLYEMLSGERAFKGETAADTMTAVLTKDPPDLDAARLDIAPGSTASSAAVWKSRRTCASSRPTISRSRWTRCPTRHRRFQASSAPAATAPVASGFSRKYLPWSIAAVATAAAIAAWTLTPPQQAINEPPRFTR